MKMTKKQAEQFKIWLIKNNLTAGKYARLCGITAQYVSLIVKGQRTIPEQFYEGGYEIKTRKN